MNFDLGVVLGRMWKIGWNHKVLWLVQILPGLFTVFLFPLIILTNPGFIILLPEPWNQLANEPWIIILFVMLMFILIVPSMFVSVMAQSATMLGALNVENGAEKLAFRALLQESLPYFWRVLGLYFIFGFSWTAVVMAFMAVNMFASMLTLGLASLCFMPAFFLLIPLIIVGYAVLELAQAAILADDMKLTEAISHGWKIFRVNMLSVTILMLILYFGLSMLISAFVFPVMFPAMLLPLAFDSSGQFNNLFLLIFMIVLPVIFLLMVVVQGILMAFFQSAWAVAYTRLKPGQDKSMPVIAGAVS
jgi:hypothetical protein